MLKVLKVLKVKRSERQCLEPEPAARAHTLARTPLKPSHYLCFDGWFAPSFTDYLFVKRFGEWLPNSTIHSLKSLVHLCGTNNYLLGTEHEPLLNPLAIDLIVV